jgi:hypothetical protein
LVHSYTSFLSIHFLLTWYLKPKHETILIRENTILLRPTCIMYFAENCVSPLLSTFQPPCCVYLSRNLNLISSSQFTSIITRLPNRQLLDALSSLNPSSLVLSPMDPTNLLCFVSIYISLFQCQHIVYALGYRYYCWLISLYLVMSLRPFIIYSETQTQFGVRICTLSMGRELALGRRILH